MNTYKRTMNLTTKELEAKTCWDLSEYEDMVFKFDLSVLSELAETNKEEIEKQNIPIENDLVYVCSPNDVETFYLPVG